MADLLLRSLLVLAEEERCKQPTCQCECRTLQQKIGAEGRDSLQLRTCATQPPAASQAPRTVRRTQFVTCAWCRCTVAVPVAVLPNPAECTVQLRPQPHISTGGCRGRFRSMLRSPLFPSQSPCHGSAAQKPGSQACSDLGVPLAAQASLLPVNAFHMHKEHISGAS